ncbi:MAG TPA: hypothetical protein VD963_05565 [Phycisphaerales bacterium]|nr:hypothetical protein [Phycisphaerales bacterium]
MRSFLAPFVMVLAFALLPGCKGSAGNQGDSVQLMLGYCVDQGNPRARVRWSADTGSTWQDVNQTFRPGSTGGVGCGMDTTGATRVLGWNDNQLIEIVTGLGATNWETIEGPNQMNANSPGVGVFEATSSPPAFQHLQGAQWLVTSRTTSGMTGLWIYDSSTYRVLGTPKTPVLAENSGVDTRPQVARLYGGTNTTASPTPTVLVWGSGDRYYSAVTGSRITPEQTPSDWRVATITTLGQPRSNVALTADRDWFYLAYVYRHINAPTSGTVDGTEENRVHVMRSADGLTWGHYGVYENVYDTAPKISAAAVGDGRVLVVGASQQTAPRSFAVIISNAQNRVLDPHVVFGEANGFPRAVIPGSAISLKAAKIP